MHLIFTNMFLIAKVLLFFVTQCLLSYLVRNKKTELLPTPHPAFKLMACCMPKYSLFHISCPVDVIGDFFFHFLVTIIIAIIIIVVINFP